MTDVKLTEVQEMLDNLKNEFEDEEALYELELVQQHYEAAVHAEYLNKNGYEV